jgi:hypothetical protein
MPLPDPLGPLRSSPLFLLIFPPLEQLLGQPHLRNTRRGSVAEQKQADLDSNHGIVSPDVPFQLFLIPTRAIQPLN